MSYIPYQLILWKIKSQMECHRKLYNTKIRCKMSTCLTNLFYKKSPDFICKLIIFNWR